MLGPVNPSTGAMRPLGVDEIRPAGGFWGQRQRMCGEVTIPHCLGWMRRLGWVDNFAGAARGDLPGGHRGREFADSEIYKLLEAMSWETGRPGGADFGPTIAELSGTIAAAQEPDGYLNTRFGHQGTAARYTDLEWGHELYCYGHLIQAGVARLRAHGEDRLVTIARRAADHVCREFGPGGRVGVPGHPEMEMALVELYRATGVERYLEQARLFVDRRGRGLLGDIEIDRSYFQDDVPVREARMLRGHAVRALYLSCGAVDVAVETGDRELLATVEQQYRRTIAARTYLTGGMGSRHTGESFGADFELPPDRAYSETCAGIASVMLAWRLLLATGDVAYADIAERTLYNVVATSPALDGCSFFYANTLHQRQPATVPDPDVESPRAAGSLRPPWFAVACCPTNLARTFASLPGYVATADDDGIQLQQLAAGDVRTELAGGRRVALAVRTNYPWEPTVSVRVTETDGRPWRLAVRVPPWADGATLTHGDERRSVGPGYAVTDRAWRPGDEIRLELPMRPRWTRPDARIDAVRGCVAAERGPLVYCAESTGQDPSVDLGALLVDTSAPPVGGARDDDLGIPLICTARNIGPSNAAAAGWPYDTAEPRPRAGSPAAPPATGEVRLTLVPYHRWGNRGRATMRVWLPEDTRS